MATDGSGNIPPVPRLQSRPDTQVTQVLRQDVTRDEQSWLLAAEATEEQASSAHAAPPAFSQAASVDLHHSQVPTYGQAYRVPMQAVAYASMNDFSSLDSCDQKLKGLQGIAHKLDNENDQLEVDDQAALMAFFNANTMLNWIKNNQSKVCEQGNNDSLAKCICYLARCKMLGHVDIALVLDSFVAHLQSVCSMDAQEPKSMFFYSSRRSTSTLVERLIFSANANGLPAACGVMFEDASGSELLEPSGPEDYKVPMKPQAFLLAQIMNTDFLAALCSSPFHNQSDVLSHQATQAMVNFKWEQWRSVFLIEFGYHCISLAAFTLWSTMEHDFKTANQNSASWVAGAAALPLVCLELVENVCKLKVSLSRSWLEEAQHKKITRSTFGKALVFVKVEMRRFVMSWSAVALFAPCGAALSVAMPQVFWLEPASAVLMWFYVFYFLQAFDHVGFFVRMILEIVYDIQGFLMIFAIALAGLSHVYYISARFDGNTLWKSAQTIYKMAVLCTFELILKDDDGNSVDIEQHGILYSTFLACTVLCNIILLNILIAVISSTYERVKEQSLAATTKGRVKIISELEMVFHRGKRHGPEFLVFFGEWEARSPYQSE